MPKINEEKLAEELEMEILEAEITEITDSLDINRVKGKSHPDLILSDNIERANRVLDILEQNARESQKISARSAEVMAQLINAVTNAANSIISDEYNKAYLQIRNNVLRLKEKEIQIKQIGGGRSGSTTNILVTDRESIMKILKEGKGGGSAPDVKQIEKGESDG
jgi:hypothetical protein